MAVAAAHDHPDLLIGSAAPLTARTLAHWFYTLLKQAPGLAGFLVQGLVKAALVKIRA